MANSLQWTASCLVCKKSYGAANGIMVEAWAKVHAKDEKHPVLVGFIIAPPDEKTCDGMSPGDKEVKSK